MVTAMAVLALSTLMAPQPLAARPRHRDHVAPSHEAAKPQPTIAASQVPLPQPRPPQAPPRGSTETAKGKDAPDKAEGKEEAAAPPPPSACRLALTDEIAIAPSIPAIHGPGGCGGDDLVRLEAVVLPDKTRVALTPPGNMRCTMATAVVNWIRNDVAPELAKLGSEIRALDNFETYECRGRNGDGSAHLSEHGRANAIDVHGFKLADGRMIDLTDRTEPRELRETVLHSACTRFSTVLGPDSDWHHENHIHLDLIERRNNYRICQWDVLDPMPKVAPLLPEPRPDDAPRPQIAQGASSQDKAKDQVNAKSGAVGEVKGSQAKTEAAGDKSKTGSDKSGKQDTRPPSGKAATETSGQASAPPEPASPAAKTPVEATKDKPESKPAAETQVGAGPAAAGKSSTEKDAADRTSANKAAANKSSAEKPSSEPGATEKASRKKGRPEKSAQRRHRHRSRMWNPFGSLF